MELLDLVIDPSSFFLYVECSFVLSMLGGVLRYPFYRDLELLSFCLF